MGGWLHSTEPADFGVESTRTAASILNHGTFSDPFPIPTGPTAHAAPAYSAIYAGVVALFGPGRASWWAIRVLTLAAYAFQLVLLPVLAVELTIGRSAGYIALDS